MKKIAFFVEGQTELIFISKLLIEIAGEKNIVIQQEESKKGRNGTRYFTAIEGVSNITQEKYYALIRNCGSDTTVKSDILDSLKNLFNKEYEKVIGLRDIYPKPRDEKQKILQGLNYGVPTKYIPVKFILAVMEVEAWFLAETKHFQKLHNRLTVAYIRNNLGIDLSNIDFEKRQHPAKDLNDIYHLVNMAYKKRKNNTIRTVEALDYADIYCILPNSLHSLKLLIQEINSFMS